MSNLNSKKKKEGNTATETHLERGQPRVALYVPVIKDESGN
ncbi:hypothetical protein [Loigolactobacillus zhaoyuanensis]|uniref:Uncharacterized protein n=1 Tax=Loigolactobacillus zhaoyuanensis TaxID=2486017 RepID=A0ABW8UHR0_9LACO|nr:hypothetical protein [Loigolactobacillus zhaoyuanensis]